MKKQFKIQTPCPEVWDHMQDTPDGKFCEKCSKCVVDFTNKTDQQVHKIIGDAGEREICGRIYTKPLSIVAAGIILVTHLSLVQAQTKSNPEFLTEATSSHMTKISGRLIFGETQQPIPNADAFFITKHRFLKSTTNENGYFSLEIPDDLLEDENVLYLNFDNLNEKRRKEHNEKDTIIGHNYGDQTIIFSKNERIENRLFQVGHKVFEMGSSIHRKRPAPELLLL
ncbi:hypothetical protein [Chryseobacterium sp. SORGH_AS_1175]|uniref:hypothetical protein n=1 Tax=Chryseobacterium sp. SORGH_AS_1175 TaxID=3041760 RepID=UPI002857209F|nr:hypothetical protein [Chryseobacterium sp. SORGH_AS_1175]MDR6129601.1 hypothetical protein [Chryseobacterium sp. SORGH_AS_1175]